MIKDTANSYTKQWWEEFLRNGAFLRISQSECLLWRGPWKSLKNTEAFDKTNEFSVSYMDFFEPESHAIWTQERPHLRNTAAIMGDLEVLGPLHETKIRRSNFTAPRQDVFEKTLQTILGKIQRGEIEKAVPVVFSRSEMVPSLEDKRAWMVNLLKAPIAMHAFGYWDLEKGIAGATPEILFRQDQGLIKTMALAGTMPRSEQATRAPLLKDEKELHEHQLVVADLDKQLSKIGFVRKGETKVMELPTLSHLVTAIEVESSKRSVQDLIRLLHPTPALGVAPRAYGFHWMQELAEQKDRGFFGAPLAFSFSLENSSVQTLCLVAIRNIQWTQQGSQIGAGCGIVKESQAEQEWQELLHKQASIFQLLGL